MFYDIPEPWHKKRYLVSYEWIKDLPHDNVLDLGGPSPFRQELYLKLWNVRGYSDVELSTIQFNTLDKYDLVLCMEVLEHIKDAQLGDTWTYSGMRNLLTHVYNVLEPNGHLFLTTPNVCCYKSIMNVLNGHHPYMYQPHVRELSPFDVTRLLIDCGLSIVKQQTICVWEHHHVTIQERTLINDLAIRTVGHVPDFLNGDCQFVLARKSNH